MTCGIQDPDRLALAIVQQYCHEHGYQRALEALQQESGLHVKDEVQRGSQLLQLVYDHLERQLAATTREESGAAAIRRRQLEEALVSGGSPSSPGPCPSRLQRSIEGLHAANIICIACWPQHRQAISGSSDGSLAVFGYDGTVHRRINAASSGVLCLALQEGPCGSSRTSSSNKGGSSPDPSSGSGRTGPGSGTSSVQPSSSGHTLLVAAGCMDGSVVVLDAGSGKVLARCQPHRKYVVATAWTPDGAHLVSGSWDHSLAVHLLRRRRPHADVAQHADTALGGTPGGAAAAAARGGSAGGDCEWELVTVHSEQMTGRVNAVTFLPSSSQDSGNREMPHSCQDPPSSSSNSSFLVAVQGSNYLRQFSIKSAPAADSQPSIASNAAALQPPSVANGGPACAAAAAAALVTSNGSGVCAVFDERRINMNELGDDHLSFSAAVLALSPCARLLLVCGDNGRLMVYEREGWTLVRSLIGLPTDHFHQHAAAFDATANYVMAAAAHGGLCIFHLGSAKRVSLLPAHSKALRGLCYDAAANLLLTCSFDRTVRVWEAAQPNQAG